MKLVIDIPEEEYNKTLQGEFNVTLAHKAVKDGKPLDTVLDKIRAEIRDLAYYVDGEMMIEVVDIQRVLDIIDKYKGEKKG